MVYEKLITVLAVLSLYVCGAGCSGKHEVTGQVFVVNAGGQNIRLGLVGIHVVDRDQLISAAEQAVTDSSDFLRISTSRRLDPVLRVSGRDCRLQLVLQMRQVSSVSASVSLT